MDLELKRRQQGGGFISYAAIPPTHTRISNLAAEALAPAGAKLAGTKQAEQGIYYMILYYIILYYIILYYIILD